MIVDDVVMVETGVQAKIAYCKIPISRNCTDVFDEEQKGPSR